RRKPRRRMGQPDVVTSIRRCVVAAMAVCASAGALAARADAAPSWLPPQNVFSTPVTAIQNDPFFNRKALDVVSDGAGDAVAVWIQQTPGGTACRAMYAVRTPGQGFGAPQPLAPAMPLCTGQIKAAMNAAGTAVVAWEQGDHIDAAIRPPSGPF